MFACEICEIFKNNYFVGHLRTAASDPCHFKYLLVYHWKIFPSISLKHFPRYTETKIISIHLNSAILILNKRSWVTLNVYFSNKFRFEQKLYYCKPRLLTRETKIRVAGLRSFIFFNQNKKSQWVFLFCESLRVNCRVIN